MEQWKTINPRCNHGKTIYFLLSTFKEVRIKLYNRTKRETDRERDRQRTYDFFLASLYGIGFCKLDFCIVLLNLTLLLNRLSYKVALGGIWKSEQRAFRKVLILLVYLFLKYHKSKKKSVAFFLSRVVRCL